MSIWPDPVAFWCSLGRPFARLSRGPAIAVLAALALALAWSSFATAQLAGAEDARMEAKSGDAIGDLELYSRIHQRYHAGEAYHAAAMDEQRQHNYPTRPFVTVRMPTLAWIDGHIGAGLWQGVALAIMVGGIMAWLGALAPHVGLAERSVAGLLIFLAGIGLFSDRALLFHELVSGSLLTLALGLYRPHRWWPALIVAALALAIRELALPFLLLWGAFAACQKRWAEMAAIAGVIVLFAIGMYLHSLGVAAERLADDPVSPGWDALIGPQIALYSMSKLTGLLFLPLAIAAPIALLALIGWIGLGGRLGLFASLWFLGFGLAMALFARTNNFYWVLLVLPAYGAGLAFVPRAIAELVQAALGRQKRQS